MTGCATIKEKESFSEEHLIESMVSRMDSLVSKSALVQQDTSWHETFIRELQQIKEKSDTSHTMVVDTAGNVIKETIIINNTREITNEKYEREMEGLMHRVEKMDSVLAVNAQQTQRIDSLVREQSKQTVVQKQEPWYKQAWNNLKMILTSVVVGMILLAVVLVLTRKWWVKFLKA